MRIRKIITGAAATVILTALSAGYSFTAVATTVDDVAAIARAYGYSEENIQAGYNEYYSHPEDYPSERLDKAIGMLHEAGSQIITVGPQVTDVPTTTTQAASAENTEKPAANTITITAADGSSFTRISREEFIKMSYDEKMAYVRTFTPEQQQAIIDNLSPEEYKSLMKQAPSDQKLQIVGTLSQAVEEMGLNITVDELTDDSLTVAMRNESGELLNVSTAGVTVEDTGYDRRGILAVAGVLIGIASASVFFLMRRFGKEGMEQ